MKKTSANDKTTDAANELPKEVRLDYAKAKPNRFAEKFEQGSIAVVLDPDVAAFFDSSESVNALLRSVILSLPRGLKPL